MLVLDVDSPPGIAVRPDVLQIPVTARLDDVAPGQAVVLLRTAAATLQARLAAVHPGAELQPRRLDLGRHTSEKAAKSFAGEAQIDGVVLVPLEESADFWARAELVARLTEALRALTLELSKAKGAIKLGFRPPSPRVRDTAPHKATLTARFQAQLRALTGGSDEPARAGSWEIPEEVAQQPISLDEVRLTLVPARRASPTRDL